MIYRVPSAVSMTSAGVELVRKTTKYVHDHYPKVSLDWLVNMTGKLNMQHWVMRFPSLAAFEKFNEDLDADAGWKQILEKSGPGPFWTSMEDNFYKVQEP